MPTAQPTQHRPQQRRRNRSRYATQLQEKQDLKNLYGIREQQLKRYYFEALRAGGETGPNMVSLLERRLDNAVYRAGFAQTRPQARQMTTHRLFQVNGRSVDIPSYSLRPGDVVTVKQSKQNKSYFSNFEKRLQNVRPPAWATLNAKDFGFTVQSVPTFDEANIGIDIRAVVEYFAR